VEEEGGDKERLRRSKKEKEKEAVYGGRKGNSTRRIKEERMMK